MKKLKVISDFIREEDNNDIFTPEIQDKIIQRYAELTNDFLEKAIRENAVPPIKGEITAGKLKWRGLKICQTQTLPSEMWITQRGKQISEKITFETIIK